MAAWRGMSGGTTYLAGTMPVTDTYTGALLWDVLNAAGMDGYQADSALGEVSASFGNAPILVAYSNTAG